MGSLCCKPDNSNNYKNYSPNPAKQNNSTYSNPVNNYYQGNTQAKEGNGEDDELLRGIYAIAILEKSGFKCNSHSGLANAINRMSPNGSTAFRDAYLIGIRKLLELHTIIGKLGFQGAWNFVHIVLTDGEDTSSKTSFNDLTAVQALLSQMLGSSVKTWLLGVDLDPKANSTKEMALLARLGGNSIEMDIVSSMQISEIFQKIVVSLGLLKTTNVVGVMTENAGLIGVEQKVTPTLLLKKNHYVVLFNLDYSGSMAGSKWRQVCSAITNFQKVLGPDDLISCIIFNDKVQTVIH